MGLAKPKQTTKTTVVPTKVKVETSPIKYDFLIQSIDSRRRYQRRGSKTPSMLRMSIQRALASGEDFTGVPNPQPLQRRESSTSSFLAKAMQQTTIHESTNDDSGLIVPKCSLGTTYNDIISRALEALKNDPTSK